MKDRIVLVTGAASGIGAATVERLAQDGATVLAFDCDGAALTALAARCSVARSGGNVAPTGGVVTTVEGDVGSQADVDRAMATAAAVGGLHGLVNAAGVVAEDHPEDVQDSTWERMLAITLTGTMRMGRAGLPLLRAAGGGAIVNVASVAAFNASPGSASYAPAKAAVLAYTRNIALVHGRDGIRANCLCPGWTRTAMAEREMADAAARSGSSVEAEFGALAERLALGRIARPEEMASCIRFLLGDEASFVTGAVLVADGGGRVSLPMRPA